MGTQDMGQGAAAGQPRIRDAIWQVRDELEALSDGELVLINLDPLASVATARGALPKILPLRGRIAEALPTFRLTQLDRLETYALALMAAHSLYCAAKGLQKDRSRLAAETHQLRHRLLTEVTFLKARGLLPQDNIGTLKGPNGHLNVACDVMTLASVLRNSWQQVSGYSAITLADLDQAEILSDNLTRAVGDRSRAPAAVIEATLQRQRAYTLFIRAYTEVRAAVAYVRKDALDADKIAPSLFRKRKRGSKTLEEADAGAATPTGATVEAPASARSGESTSTSAGTSNTTKSAPAEGPLGSDPFLH